VHNQPVPRKPTLSPTKISAFLACPFKYYWTYNDDRGRWYLRAKSYYSFGTTLHRVLQRFHDAGDVGVATTEQALAAYEESWIDAGFTSPEEMQEAFGEGREILERHIEEVRARPSEAKVLFVEKQLRMPFGDDFDLIGRVDRVDEYPDGSLEIVDYKSGRQVVSEEEIQTDLAMGTYQLLLREKFPDRPIRATIVALRTGKSATYSMPQEEMDEFRFDIGRIGKQILGTEWPENRPVSKPTCAFCDFLPLCRQDPEFDWPAG
jgi:putative RecB family exonuclease